MLKIAVFSPARSASKPPGRRRPSDYQYSDFILYKQDLLKLRYGGEAFCEKSVCSAYSVVPLELRLVRSMDYLTTASNAGSSGWPAATALS